LKKRRIEERRIIVAGARPIAGMTGKLLNRDVLGNFERELQLGGRGGKQLAPVIRGRELVKREIAANDRKCFGVFGQAFVVEALLRETAAREIALLGINLPEPAFVFPGAGADENILGSEGSEPSAEPLAVDAKRLLEQRRSVIRRGL
jgi:hypothetical protein